MTTTHKITDITMEQANLLIGRKFRAYHGGDTDPAFEATCTAVRTWYKWQRLTCSGAAGHDGWTLNGNDFIEIDGHLPWDALTPAQRRLADATQSVADAQRELEQATLALESEGLPEGWRWGHDFEGPAAVSGSGSAVNCGGICYNGDLDHDKAFITEGRDNAQGTTRYVTIRTDVLFAWVDRVRAEQS